MKKILIILLALTVSAVVFAQQTESELIDRVNELERQMEEIKSRGVFKIDGEVKTGIFWEKVEDRLADDDPFKVSTEDVRLHSRDDAGNSSGRFRLNIEYLNAGGNLGFKARLQWDDFNNAPVNGPIWPYAFGFGNFFNDQLTVSIGKLGASPWGTGGPELWRELELTTFGGMRIEYKPNLKFLPAEQSVNVGFVLNWYDDIADSGNSDYSPTIIDLLSETVVGLSYKNKWFMIRGAYRFDSVLDQGAARSGQDATKEGTKLLYRVEEYALNNLLKDLSAWALGEFYGLGADNPEDMFRTRNWLIVQYEPKNFTAQIRFGLDATHTRTLLYARPNFSYRFFNGLLEPGIIFGIGQDFGDKLYADSPYSYIEVEPKLQVNFAFGNYNAYTAFVYYYRLEYKYVTPPPELMTQWINLRFGIKF